jgi:histidyl-tRNA synthetase
VLSLVAAVRRAKRSLRYRVTVPLLRLPPEGQALHPTPAELARDNPVYRAGRSGYLGGLFRPARRVVSRRLL